MKQFPSALERRGERKKEPDSASSKIVHTMKNLQGNGIMWKDGVVTEVKINMIVSQ